MSDQHYRSRIRMLLSYVQHKNECRFAIWQIAEHIQKSLGPSYSAGAIPPCTCGLAVLAAIAHAEVYDENGNPV